MYFLNNHFRTEKYYFIYIKKTFIVYIWDVEIGKWKCLLVSWTERAPQRYG